MDLETLKILKRLDLHLKVRKILTIASYFLIFGGFFVYIFYALDQTNQKYKLVADIKNNRDKFQSEKIMINPRIRFQYNDRQIYEIEAKKASHKNNEEVTLFDVFATGEIGNITAGELQIDESGDHLLFLNNPVLILNEQKKSPSKK